MINRIGKYTLEFTDSPLLIGWSGVAGKKEGEGPMKREFDAVFDDTSMGQKSWEKAESLMIHEAVVKAIDKSGLPASQINFIYAGDLLNQCIASTFGIRELDIPFLGIYGACSTMAEGLILASIACSSGAAKTAITATSSHFCTAERQYRFPLEYGGQRPPSAQWTVTGAGAVVVKENPGNTGKGVVVTRATVGRIQDLGIKDANNMGAAMAPAAVRTILDFFTDTGARVEDYDLIVSGDLGVIGSEVMKELLQKEGFQMGSNYTDCGLLMFDRNHQDVHAGGSGCGCSGSLLGSYILNRLGDRRFQKVLFMATGALLSPTSQQQGESIPGIAHLVELSVL